MAGPVARQPLVVDSSVSCLTAAPALAARGVKVVMRYYSRPGYPQTILSANEAKAIHNSGMAIGLVYQYFSGDIANFDTQSAHDAATACMNRDASLNPGKPETIHHPKGTVIYFGVDGDLTGVADQDLKKDNIETILNFFTVVGQDFSAKNAPFDIGVYGSGDVCERLVGPGLAKYGWMAGFSIGWTGTRDVYNESATPPHWHMFQNALEVRLEVPVDTNILNPRSSGIIGAFDKHGLIGPLDDSAIRTSLRFVTAPQGTTLFETPEQHPLGTVARNRMVSLLEQQGPTWSKVETTFHSGNTGTTKQGYMRSAVLASIDRMA
jgi:hypothetical protein